MYHNRLGLRPCGSTSAKVDRCHLTVDQNHDQHSVYMSKELHDPSAKPTINQTKSMVSFIDLLVDVK